MAVTVERFLDYFGGDPNTDTAKAQDTLAVAVIMVENYVGDSIVPEPVVDLAVLRVASALWSAEHVQARSNDSFYETNEAPAPTNRDPMTAAYVLLRKWVLPW